MPSGWRRGFKRKSEAETDRSSGTVVGKAPVAVRGCIDVGFLLYLTIQAVNEQRWSAIIEQV